MEQPLLYFVRCASCDRAFWQQDREAPVPVHPYWDRRIAAQPVRAERCDGSERPGYWIGEGQEPLPTWSWRRTVAHPEP